MASEPGLIISQNTEEYDTEPIKDKDCTLVDVKDDLIIQRLIRHSKSFGTTYMSSAGSSIDNKGKYIRQTSYPVINSYDKPETYDPRFNKGTRSKLLLLNDKLIGFEKQMELQAKQRRQLEESRLANINESLNKLQNAITVESKKRMETIKALHGIFESQIVSVQSKMESVFNQKLDQLETVIDSLSERLDNIQKYVNDYESKFLNTIEVNCVTLEKSLASIQKTFESEKIARQEREDQIVKKISEIELKADTSINNELQNITTTYQTLKNEIFELKRYKQETEKELKSTISDEIANINNSLVLESRARENADDDIVLALQSYAKVLADYSRLHLT